MVFRAERDINAGASQTETSGGRVSHRTASPRIDFFIIILWIALFIYLSYFISLHFVLSYCIPILPCPILSDLSLLIVFSYYFHSYYLPTTILPYVFYYLYLCHFHFRCDYDYRYYYVTTEYDFPPGRRPVIHTYVSLRLDSALLPCRICVWARVRGCKGEAGWILAASVASIASDPSIHPYFRFIIVTSA